MSNGCRNQAGTSPQIQGSLEFLKRNPQKQKTRQTSRQRPAKSRPEGCFLQGEHRATPPLAIGSSTCGSADLRLGRCSMLSLVSVCSCIRTLRELNTARRPTRAGGLFATFGGKMIEILVVKHSLLRGSPIFSQVAKKLEGEQQHFQSLAVKWLDFKPTQPQITPNNVSNVSQQQP